MAIEERIRLTKDDSGLTQLRKNLEGAKLDFANLKLSGKATEQALKEAGQEVVRLGTQFSKMKQEISDLGNKAEIATGKLGKGMKASARFISATVGSTVQLAGAIGFLSSELEGQDGKWSKITDKVASYSLAIAGVGGALANLKYLLPVLTVGTFAIAGMTTAVLALGSAFGVLMNTIGNLNISEGFGNLIALKTWYEGLGKDKIDTNTGARPITLESEFTPMGLPKFNSRTGGFEKFNLSGFNTPTIDNDLFKTPSGGNLGKVAKKIVEKTQQELYIEMLKQANENLKFGKSARIDERQLTLLQQMNLSTPKGSTALGQTPSEVQMSGTELRDQLLSTLSEAGNNLISIVDMFGIKADSTFTKMIDGINTLLTTIQSIISFINSINAGVSIFKTLFRIATGGADGSTGGMPYVNPSGSSMGGNNYFKIDLNTMEIIKDGLPKYNEYKGAIAVS